MTHSDALGPVGFRPGSGSPLDVAIAERDHDILKMVKTAIEKREVWVAYQPVVRSSRPNPVAFYEAMIRVIDETGRLIPAGEFIPACENDETGRKLDCIVLIEGMRALRANPSLRLSINMSARSIGYRPWLKALERGLNADATVAERLIVEVTEGSVVMIPDVTKAFVRDVQKSGIAFALDDFGAGFTSFKNLQDIGFDILKIDGQFTKNLTVDTDKLAIIRTMIALAKNFEMMTIAESVETASDAEVLQNMGVDCLQGYYFGAPTVKPAWPEFAGSHRSAAAFSA